MSEVISSSRLSTNYGVMPSPQRVDGANDRPYLMSVRRAAEYLGRSEKAVRHLYERRLLTPLRIDGRVFLDRREIDDVYERARAEAY
jgi:hypothetical protein